MARILLSEADPDVRRLLVILLEQLGHDVVALEGQRDPAPPADLMVLEPAWRLGLDHARRVRAAQPGLPVLCVSVLSEEARFLELGPVAYLAKPFGIEELRAAVERALALGPGGS